MLLVSGTGLWLTIALCDRYNLDSDLSAPVPFCQSGVPSADVSPRAQGSPADCPSPGVERELGPHSEDERGCEWGPAQAARCGDPVAGTPGELTCRDSTEGLRAFLAEQFASHDAHLFVVLPSVTSLVP